MRKHSAFLAAALLVSSTGVGMAEMRGERGAQRPPFTYCMDSNASNARLL